MSTLRHGMWNTTEYRIWTAMKQRCLNPVHVGYPRYGGRGITVHPEWMESFESFFDHVGHRPGLEFSLDRIDNDGNYEPGNVRWATRSEQAQNRQRRTTCRNGLHAFTPENTLWYRGHRRCRECTRIRRNKGVELKPCGTPAGYQRHYSTGEKPCDACREARAKVRRMEYRRKRESEGFGARFRPSPEMVREATQRAQSGESQRVIAADLGVSQASVWRWASQAAAA